MSATAEHLRPRRVTPLRLSVAAGVATVGLAVTGIAVFAGLNATASNTTAESVTSGTLKLTMAANGAGFTTAVSNVAPGDVINRYVTLTNGGTLDANGLTLAVADSTPTKLTTDATNGLHVTVNACTGGSWTVSSGACTGGTLNTLLSNVALSSITSATPGSLVNGAITANATYPLQISVTLPNQSETTVNGTLPASTIQGLSASLTWTFNENQRTATTTNS